MTTLHQFVPKLPDIPMVTAWYLSDLAEAKGRQQLYTLQSPQRLKVLREHAMIESAVASNRIEGVEIDPARVRTVVLGKPTPRDRNEQNKEAITRLWRSHPVGGTKGKTIRGRM